MPSAATTLGDLAQLVRTKNAGPFWLTIDVFFRDHADYTRVTAAAVLTASAVAELYRVDANTVRLFHLPAINVIKASFPRPTTQGSFDDRDIHAGQQHVPLLTVPVPAARD
jgi:Domain of unknown function (DUF4387)